MSSTVTLQTASHRDAPRLARPIAESVAALIATVSGWLRPRPLTRGEEAARLRQLAAQFHAQPSFAADLLAAADRHVTDSE
jgi:hypothetical protein